MQYICNCNPSAMCKQQKKERKMRPSSTPMPPRNNQAGRDCLKKLNRIRCCRSPTNRLRGCASSCISTRPCNSSVPRCRLSAPRQRSSLPFICSSPAAWRSRSCLRSTATCSPCSVVDARRCSFSLSGAWCWRAASCASCNSNVPLCRLSQLLLASRRPRHFCTLKHET